MSLNRRLLLFTILFVSTVRPIKEEIYEVGGIEKFIDKIDQKAIKYELENVTLGDEEKNIIFQVMIEDLVSALGELNNITSDWIYQYPDDLAGFVHKLEEHCIKNDLCEWAYLSNVFNRIKDKYEDINANVALLFDFYRNNAFEDLTKYCSFVSNYIQFNKENYRKSLTKQYGSFMHYASTQVNKTDWNIFRNDSESIQQEINSFYRRIMITYLKEFTIFYFADFFNRRCLNHEADKLLSGGKERLMFQFSNNINETQELLRVVKNH